MANKNKIIKLSESKSKETVLGLDCSSATIGWGFISLDEKPVLKAYGYIKPLNSKHPDIERFDNVYSQIYSLCEELAPTCVSIEDIFLFMGGGSTARTITLLAAVNRISALAAYHYTKNVNFYSVHNIRKIIKNMHNVDGAISKDMMPDLIIEYLDDKFTKEFRVNRKGEKLVKDETHDEADGIAAAWACALHKLNEDFITPLIEPKPKKKKRKRK